MATFFKNLLRHKTRMFLTVSGIAVGMAMIVAMGAVGGLYPAWRAGNLSPVEALRYE
jgi:ABC-type antimicrobial peptide transport system permease subunit